VSAADQLATFSDEETAVTAALISAHMTAGPDGRRVDLQDRLADIHARHANEDTDSFATRMSREPLLVAAVERVERGWPVCLT
jgi:hypothetical protein